MQLPGPTSLLFLAFVLVLLPWGARRTAQRLRGELPGTPVSRVLYWRSAVLLQVVLLVFAWFTGTGFGYGVFAVVQLGWTEVFLSFAAIGLCFGLRRISRWARSEEELRGLSVYQRAPRTGAELTWFSVAVVTASVAEEAAYRGVGWSILWYSLGNPWLAALIMSVAFSLIHWNQGWKSGVTIFGFATVLHGLVALTNTLVLAMVVHAVYDFVVGYEIRRTAQRLDHTTATNM